MAQPTIVAEDRSHPTVSVCIPTRNRPDLLSIQVRSILVQTFTDFEIIISDNSDGPHTESLVKFGGEQCAELHNAQVSVALADKRVFAIVHRPERRALLALP